MFKKISTIYIFLFFVIFSYSQTPLEPLTLFPPAKETLIDKHNGINSFSFGDNIKLYNHKITPIDIRTNQGYSGKIEDHFGKSKTKYYRVSINYNENLFGVRYKQLILGFDEERLSKIIFVWDYNYKDFNKIKSEFDRIYGFEKIHSAPYTFGESSVAWHGANVSARLKDRKILETGLFESFYLEIENFKYKRWNY